MRRIILLCLFCLCLKQGAALNPDKFDTERYRKLINSYFNFHYFDKCIYNYYILAHYYVNSNDSSNLKDIWYNIGILNLMQNQSFRAEAAYKIAYSFRSKIDTGSNLLENRFLFIKELLKAEKKINNNIVFRKLKIALRYNLGNINI